MRKFLPSGRCRLAVQLMAAGGLATVMSGCSSDVTRLTDPFTNPFSTASNEEAPPARVAPRHVASADVIPAGRMPPVSSQALAPRASSVAYSANVSRETTGSIEPGPVRTASGAAYGNWTSTGGTPVVVAEGESAEVLAQRYGVPASALLQVNGLHGAGEVRPGAHITIPVYSASAAPRSEHVAQQAPVRMEERVAVRTVPEHGSQAPGRWVSGPAPARSNAAAPGRIVTAQRIETPAARLAPSAHQRPGVAPKPDSRSSRMAAAPLAAPTPRSAPLQRVAVAKASPALPMAPAAVPRGSVKAAPLVAARLQTPAAEAPRVAVEPPPAAPAPTASADNSPEFRWPARGRIIQAFKGGSGGNDGINIAVPEGTPVKAAEGGVVAYAGSELKGYGNLVLIRHPNGFVSAYANNGSIDVKRGETVKRGQEIAKSGQSGNVSSPQLHFELRKGSTPVDPTQYLAGL